ncbi:oligosaccharide flippase family protein [Ravibacter arvi]|uniref:Oligosaccharide flippase family protein n=1 Tax=Ravibacter arvi TaxID=2051041 RepID=A0ABP8MBI7_9BACT
MLKKLASDTALYGVSTMLGRMINYLLVMLHTELFAPAELAVQVQLYAFTGIALVLYSFGMETAFFRFARDQSDRARYYNLILSAVILVSVVFSGVLLAGASGAAAAIGYPDDAKLVRWFALILAADSITSIPFARLRLEEKARKFVAIKFGSILLLVGLNLLFLVVFRDIYEGKYLASLGPLISELYNPLNASDYIILANLISSLVVIPLLSKEFSGFRFIFSWQLFRPVWVYAFPILVMNLGAIINLMFDRVFLRELLPDGFYPGRTTEEAIGIYGQCFKLSIFMNLAIQAFKYAAEPFFFSRGVDKNAPPVFARIMKWFIIACSLMWVAISINLDVLSHFFLRRSIYHEGVYVAPWLLAGFLFLGIYYNLAAWFKLTDKTAYGTYLSIAGAVVVILLNYWLVPLWGYLGCAVAFAGSGFTMMVLCYYFGQKYYPIPYDLASAAGYLGGGLGVILLFSQWRMEDLTISFLVHSAALLLACLSIFLVERKEFRRRDEG